MSEYKEWALAEGYIPQKLDSVYGFDEAKEYFNKYELVNPIRVIEYAAFKKLQKDWEQAATQNYADKCEIEKLKKQNEIMREALEFYADIERWKTVEHCELKSKIRIDAADFDAKIDNDMMYFIAGKRARQALKDVEGVG